MNKEARIKSPASAPTSVGQEAKTSFFARFMRFCAVLLLSTLYFLLSTPHAYAMCPVCTVAVAAGVGLSRYLGIDDLITGLWVGALLVSISMWTSNWLNKQRWAKKVPKSAAFWFLIWAVVTFYPLYMTNFIGHPSNRLWGVDRLVMGSLFGILIFTLAVVIHYWLKAKNNDKVFVAYQRVIVPVGMLFVTSIILFFITKK